MSRELSSLFSSMNDSFYIILVSFLLPRVIFFIVCLFEKYASHGILIDIDLRVECDSTRVSMKRALTYVEELTRDEWIIMLLMKSSI